MNEEQAKNYFTGCKLIMEHYGVDNQKKQLIQELGELIVALTKNDLINIIEEMADVQVMLDQFTITRELVGRNVEVYQLQKVKRQLKRIKDEKEKFTTPPFKNNIRLKEGVKEKLKK